MSSFSKYLQYDFSKEDIHRFVIAKKFLLFKYLTIEQIRALNNNEEEIDNLFLKLKIDITTIYNYRCGFLKCLELCYSDKNMERIIDSYFQKLKGHIISYDNAYEIQQQARKIIQDKIHPILPDDLSYIFNSGFYALMQKQLIFVDSSEYKKYITLFLRSERGALNLLFHLDEKLAFRYYQMYFNI